MPVKLNPAPVADIPDTVTAELPLLEMVSESSLLLARGMVPNCKAKELAASSPGAGGLLLDEFELKLQPVQANVIKRTDSTENSRVGDRRTFI